MVVEGPRSIVLSAPCGHFLLFSSLVELGSSLRCITFSPASSEDIVYIDFSDQSVELSEEIHALRGSFSHVRAIKNALVLLELIIKIGVI